MGKLAVLTRLCASIADEYERGEKVDSGAVSASTTRIFDLLLQSQSRSSSEAMIHMIWSCLSRLASAIQLRHSAMSFVATLCGFPSGLSHLFARAAFG